MTVYLIIKVDSIDEARQLEDKILLNLDRESTVVESVHPNLDRQLQRICRNQGT